MSVTTSWPSLSHPICWQYARALHVFIMHRSSLHFGEHFKVSSLIWNVCFDLLDPLALNCFQLAKCWWWTPNMWCHRLILSVNGGSDRTVWARKMVWSFFAWSVFLCGILVTSRAGFKTSNYGVGWRSSTWVRKPCTGFEFFVKVTLPTFVSCLSACLPVCPTSFCMSVCMNPKSSLAASFEMICFILISRFGCCLFQMHVLVSETELITGWPCNVWANIIKITTCELTPVHFFPVVAIKPFLARAMTLTVSNSILTTVSLDI